MAGEQTYEAAGVSIAKADAVVVRLRAAAASTGASGFGAFAGLHPLGDGRLLAASTDGVGTKLSLARERGALRACGADLAAHCINDVLTTGADPLLFLDYVAANRIDLEQVAELVEGAAEVCRAAGVALVGTEVKSLREGHAQLEDSYAKLEDGELFLVGAEIPEYLFGTSWINTWWPLILPSWIGGGAFNVFLLRQFLMQLPRDLDEAATIDGAGPFRILWSILLPLTQPALATVAIFSFLAHWRDFIHPLIYLNSREKFPLSLGLRALQQLPLEASEPREHITGHRAGCHDVL